MLTATIESFEQKFGPISSYLDFDTIQYCIDIGSDIIIDNNNHGCLNILFFYYALLDDNLDHLRTLLKLEGTSKIYFNFHTYHPFIRLGKNHQYKDRFDLVIIKYC